MNAADNSNEPPLHHAALRGKGDVVKTLLDQGADVNAGGRFCRTALHAACQKGHVSCIHKLIAVGAQIEAKDSAREATPLILAAQCNHPDSVKILVDVYKASINVTDKFGRTALHHAAFNGSTDVVRVLVSNPQCDFTIRSRRGDTAAEVARTVGHSEIAALIDDTSALWNCWRQNPKVSY